jgi:endonuclease G
MDISELPQHVATLIEESAPERARVRALVQAGRWREAEPDRIRLDRFTQKKLDKLAPPGAEAIIGPTIDLQAANFLTRGVKVRRAIGFVEVNSPTGSEVGTGFLISPALFLTCCHVIADINAARGTQITFDRELDENGRPKATTMYLLDPDRFALFSEEGQLDYALIAVGVLNAGNTPLTELGFCPLSDTPDRHVLGMNVNIIQHPRGWTKMIAVRNNVLTFRTDRSLLYETDTDEGSSGAAVFNDDWEVVALHHWGQPFLARVDEHGSAVPAVNEGVRISAIYRDLQARLPSLPLAQQQLLSAALALAAPGAAGSSVATGPQLSPPHAVRPLPAGQESFPVPAATHNEGAIMNSSADLQAVRITIPLELTLRLAGGTVVNGMPAAPVGLPVTMPGAEQLLMPAAPKTLTRGAEALKVDIDYDNRSGYDAGFIPNASVPLPAPGADLLKDLVLLRGQQADHPEAGELRYEHFSLKLHRSRRMAVYTATNIDGATYLTVDRQTGLAEPSEGETWFKDPRISASYTLDQSFYNAWSTYFDRGHLTRRTDPTWGSPAEAERANADTFHFTNCTPQHFRFNQTTPYWQGAERYVLENGLLTQESKQRICVFQGPIFNDKIDLWADDVQIPSSFFKVVVWHGAQGLKAVGLVVDQLPLLSEPRRSLGQPHAVPAVDVTQWRVAIPQIEQRTGLDFGDAVRQADTIAQGAQPVVGEEAARPLRSFADILA